MEDWHEDDETVVDEGAVCPVTLGQRLARLGSASGARRSSTSRGNVEDMQRMSLAALNLEGTLAELPMVGTNAPVVEWEEPGHGDVSVAAGVGGTGHSTAKVARRRRIKLRAWWSRCRAACKCYLRDSRVGRRWAAVDRATVHFVLSLTLLGMVGVVATVFALLGVTSSHWAQLDPPDPFSGSAGLWHACPDDVRGGSCVATADIPGVHAPTLQGAQATALLCATFGGCSLPVLLLSAAAAARHPPETHLGAHRFLDLQFRLLGAACWLLLLSTVCGMTATALWLVVGVNRPQPDAVNAAWEFGAWMHNSAWLVFGVDALAATWAWVPVCRKQREAH